MRWYGFFESFNFALQGIVHTLKTQLNMKVHFLLAFLVLGGSLLFEISRLELIILFITIVLVIALELINTAIEVIVDMVSQEYSLRARIAKNIASGAVFMAALNAVLVGYLLFYEQLSVLSLDLIHHIKQNPSHLIFINLGLLLILIIYLKARSESGTPLQGGMPSGHTAIAFSLVTIILMLSTDFLVISLVVILALMIAQSRLETGAHNFWEVLIGALLGITLSLIIFQFCTI
ncbi:MAG: diacylglycerol kinase [Bacillota bacterium]